MTSEERLRKAVAECVGMPIYPLPESDELIVPLYAFVRVMDATTLALNLEREKTRNQKRELAELRESTSQIK